MSSNLLATVHCVQGFHDVFVLCLHLRVPVGGMVWAGFMSPLCIRICILRANVEVVPILSHILYNGYALVSSV